MLTLPNVPTDNMYKFISIAGVATTIAAFVVIVQMSMFLINDLDLRGEQMVAKVLVYARERGISTSASEETKEGRELTAYREYCESVHLTRTNLYQEALRSCTIAAAILCCGGVLLTYYGFRNWYSKVQKLQDGILQAEYEQEIENIRKLKLELSSLPIPAVVPAEVKPISDRALLENDIS